MTHIHEGRRALRHSLALAVLLLLSCLSLTDARLLYNRTTIPRNYVLAKATTATPALSGPPSTDALMASVCPNDTPMTFAMGLTQQNLDVLHDLFSNVTNPKHPMYQKYQTPTTLWNLIGPSPNVVSNIGRWLVNNGIPVANIHFYGDVMECYTNCGVVNRLFNTTMYIFNNTQTGAQIISQWGPSYVPDRFAAYIAMVIGVQTFPIPAQSKYVYGDAKTSVGAWDEPESQFLKTPKGKATHEMATKSRTSAGVSSVSEADAEDEWEWDENAEPSFNMSAHHWQTMGTTIPNSAVVIPASIQVLYGLPDRTTWYPPNGYRPTVSTCVVEFASTGRQSYNPVDLRHFADYSGFSYPYQLNPKYVVGSNQRNKPGLEATLDLQTITTINNQAAAWFWLMPTNTWMYSWAYQFYSQIVAGLPYPQVVSISYTSSDEYFNCGIPGSMDCEVYGINPSDMGDSFSYEARTNTLFQMIGLSGVTIVVASGDDGANGIYGATELTGTSSTSCTYTHSTLQFIPEWPSTSPYVTSVGATNLKAPGFGRARYSNGQNSKAQLCGRWTASGAPPFNFHCYIANLHEAAVDLTNDGFTSGGGFSTIYSQPWYQAQAVDGWLASNPHLPAYPANSTSYLFNRRARAFPDVSAYGGAEWLTLFQSQFRFVAGTSISAPIFAGVVSLLNEIALQYGKRKPLGFINPLLYQMQMDTFGSDTPTFNDITVGDNRRPRNVAAGVKCDGFDTAVGWDPVTGLGTPNFVNMKNYLINLLTTNNEGYQYSSTGAGMINSTASTGVDGATGPNSNIPDPNDGGVVGDPQFNGFNGQSFQIHGVPDAIYNIISTPIFQFNAEFTFLQEGYCNAELQARTMCWTHPGNYLGSVAILIKDPTTDNETTLLVRSGAYDEGMLVFINDRVLSTAVDQMRVPAFGSSNPLLIRYSDRFTLTIQSTEFIVQLDNSHHFVNQQVAMTPGLTKRIKAMRTVAQKAKRPLNASELQSLPHGLLGQTWNERQYNNQWRHIAGHVADYQLSDGLLGHEFVYNRFRFDQDKEEQRLKELAELKDILESTRGIERMTINGAVAALMPGTKHTHNEDEDEDLYVEDVRNVLLANIKIPLTPSEEDELNAAEDEGIRTVSGTPLGQRLSIDEQAEDLPMTPIKPSKSVNNKLRPSREFEGDNELVWSSVQPESVEHYEGALDADNPMQKLKVSMRDRRH